MEFKTINTPETVIKTLTHFATNMVAGAKFKIELGDEELDETVPDGKIWNDVRLVIHVTEIDA